MRSRIIMTTSPLQSCWPRCWSRQKSWGRTHQLHKSLNKALFLCILVGLLNMVWEKCEICSDKSCWVMSCFCFGRCVIDSCKKNVRLRPAVSHSAVVRRCFSSVSPWANQLGHCGHVISWLLSCVRECWHEALWWGSKPTQEKALQVITACNNQTYHLNWMSHVDGKWPNVYVVTDSDTRRLTQHTFEIRFLIRFWYTTRAWQCPRLSALSGSRQSLMENTQRTHTLHVVALCVWLFVSRDFANVKHYHYADNAQLISTMLIELS